MRLHPTRATFQVGMAGAALLALGIALRLPPVASFGGAMVIAIAIGKAAAVVSVTRLRRAGFEMVWSTNRRVLRGMVGEELQLEAELRNRGIDAVRGVAVRAVASSRLSVSVVPAVVDLPPHTAIRVGVRIRPQRVGRWGVHGMALEVRGTPAGGEGLYEVPLMFANPLGVEVFPRALGTMHVSPRGGRARRGAELGRPGNLPGEGDELRELRDHSPGDPFKRIAWKASARRGKLLVREMEREERDLVWMVVDASVDLWAGPEGRAPLDSGVEEIATLAARHMMRGDRVGLVVYASRIRTWLAPGIGPTQAHKIAAALASAASTIDADRSELDESEIAVRVFEHARPLDARGLSDVSKGNLDALARRAESLRGRAPFAPRLPYARTHREQMLRHYLASFGVEVAPRSEGEREKSQIQLAAVLDKLLRDRHRPSIIHLFAQVPNLHVDLASRLRKAKMRHTQVSWTVPDATLSVADPAHASSHADSPSELDLADPVGAVHAAVRFRAELKRVRAERLLKRLGAPRLVTTYGRR